MPDAPQNDDLRTRLQRSLGESIVIDRELGGGGMARVFLATETALERRIVVKALDMENSVAAGAERFRREIRVVAQLQHPHIVPVFAAGGDDTLLWYTMPYVSGESLRARLTRDGALPLADAIRITREVLDALSAAHGRGIFHRDIKPENILLESVHAQVADFGVAKALSEAGVGSTLTTVGLALGTPAYMAPEQAMADPSTNHRADLYAVGAVLYEMLVGAPPFSGNAQSVVAAHLTAPVPQLSDRRRDIPPQIASLTSRLLAKMPAERPQSAAEAIASLDSITTPAAAQATPERRTRTPLIAAGVLGLAALGVAAFWNSTRAAVPDFADGTEVIAVMPLGSAGDSAMAQLGRNLVVTLSANIDGVGTIRTVDAMSVLQRAAAVPQPVSLDAARQLAVSLGATFFVHGALVPEDGGVRADAALHDVKGGEPLARIRAQNLVTGLRELSDSLSSDLLRQIWRRGEAPSPMLADAATPSGDALRAFLDGEAAFERFDIAKALDAYDRATDFDSNFVQAWLRKAHVRYAAVLPVGDEITRRLDALFDRMPARDKALRLTLPPDATFEDQLRAQEDVAARFPEYHMAQYRASDLIIHFGPVHGIPMRNAIPYLDRMDSLAPRHADNAQHRWMVAFSLGDTAAIIANALRLDSLSRGSENLWTKSFVVPSEAYARTGHFLDAATATAAIRAGTAGLSALPIIAEVALLLPPMFTLPAQIDSAYAAVANDIEIRPFQRQYLLGRGSQQFARGDIASALATFGRLERMDGPGDVRGARIRSTALAAWLGLMTPAEADAAFAESRRVLTDTTSALRHEIAWSDAVMAIVTRDSVRFQAAVRTMADTSRAARHIARGLRALWRERLTGAVDSLMQLTDDDMLASVNPDPVTVALSRLAIGRSLTLSGDGRRAEHYLQWTDGLVPTRRSTQVVRSIFPYTSYQRGLAAEAAGDHRAAILHLRRFVDFVDMPPPALTDQVNDAKARLARLMDRSG